MNFASFYDDQPVLVTGPRGFIGSHLGARLTNLGARLTPFEADIRDEAAIREAVIGQKVIFHLAGRSGAVASNLQPLEDLEVNCKGLLNLLEACRLHNPEARIVFASSRLVYGPPQQLPVTEAHPTRPTSIYGLHKLTSEHYLRMYHELYGIPAVSLRITNPYGPVYNLKNRSYGVLNIFMQLALSNATIKLYGQGSQLRDFIYIDDLVEAFLVVGQGPKMDGDVFNVCGDEAVSLREAAEIIVSEVGRGEIEHVPWPPDTERVETGDFLADITKIKRMTGWQPRTKFRKGIQKAIAQVSLL